MKSYHFFRLFTLLCFLTVWSSCSDESGDPDWNEGSTALSLSYQIDGADQVQTYALTAETHECRVDEIYTLFFRSSTHALANRFVGYTRTGISSSTATGTARVTMPPGADVTDEWQLIVLANLDRFAYVDGEADVDDWLTNKVGTHTYSAAKSYIQGICSQRTGLLEPLPMSVSMTKPAATNLATVTLKRRVARIDVSNSAANFVFETAQLYNARTMTYLLDEGGNVTVTGGNNFVNYDQHVVSAGNGTLQAKLYAFPNVVTMPNIRDHETTCLIVGGKYNGSTSTTYYRVNVCPAGGSQNLKANGAYTINITNVTAAGDTDPGDAFDASSLKIDYTINEWDDSFLGTYIFDAHGNGLAVSQRNIIFSDKANQTVQLEVFTINSSTNPISGSWAVGAPTGTDAAEFAASKVVSPADKYITVNALTNNATTTDRTASFNIVWGGISLPVNITQLNPTSQMGGLKVNPSELWFPLAGATKEVCVNLQGNFSGVTRADITSSILYNSTGSNWLTLSAGTTADNPAAGLYYFNVTAPLLTTGSIRQAAIKFVVTRGSLVATAQVDVAQTTTDLTVSPTRILSVRMFEKNSTGTYVDKGTLLDRYSSILGLPSGQSGDRHLHFAIISCEQIKYEFSILSSMSWKIVAPSNAGSYLVFSQTSGTADIVNTYKVTVTALQDVSSGWDGTFYIEYENGDQDVYIVHQQGVLKTLDTYNGGTANGNTYYYGTISYNGKLWLDRNLGATIGQNGAAGYWGGSTNTTFNATGAMGVHFNRAEANTACPSGFRLPSRSSTSYFLSGGAGGNNLSTGTGEFDFMYNNLMFTNSGGTGIPPYAHYVTVSSSPVVLWYLPVAGFSGNNNIYGCCWAQTAGYLQLVSTSVASHSTIGYSRALWPTDVWRSTSTAAPWFAANANTYTHSVRCVQS